MAGGGTAVLIDAGLTAKETGRRLGEIGVPLSDIQAICLTHEHGDHIAGLRVLHRRFGVPVYANSGTAEGADGSVGEGQLEWRIFTTGMPFQIGELEITPFSVPHDAYDPVGFVIRHGGAQLGLVTDAGTVTTLVRERLRGCQAIMIECNHDEQMLKDSKRPWALKQRIFGRQGHLSNASAAALLADVAEAGLTHVFLAHLSSECNRVEAATQAVRASLDERGFSRVSITVALRDRVSVVWTSA